MGLPYMDLVQLIRGAGKLPVERDSLYRTVRDRFDDPPPAGPDTQTPQSVRGGLSLPVVHAA
jgi:hypothetical protein